MEFARAFEASRGLCLPHLDLVHRLAPEHPNLSRLLEVHIPKVKRLQADFQDVLRRAKAPLPTLAAGEAETVWAHMLEWAEGKATVFGPERDLARQGMGWRRLLALARRPRIAQPRSIDGEGEERGMSESHRLGLENEKLQRRLVEVSREWAEESARRAAVQYQVHKLSEDVKVLELNLAGARGEAQAGEIQAARLREEIDALRREVERLREHHAAA
jgi:regulator of replication initiation timing